MKKIFLFVVFLTISTLAQSDSTKAEFGYAFQIKEGLKYHLYSDCFTIKNKNFKIVKIEDGKTCKNCVYRLYAEEIKKKEETQLNK